jgi:hypothetical protein
MELVAGIVVAVAALALVLEPLVRGSSMDDAGASPTEDLDFTDIQESGSAKVQALLALKEIEFDRATGKLSDEDYSALKARYARAALEAIKTEDVAMSSEVGEGETDEETDDPAEAAIRKARALFAVCPVCGPRPESDTSFCSDCGRQLVPPEAPARCPSCGSTVSDGGRFCSACGAELGALARR